MTLQVLVNLWVRVYVWVCVGVRASVHLQGGPDPYDNLCSYVVPQKSPMMSDSVAERNLQLKTSYTSLPCIMHPAGICLFVSMCLLVCVCVYVCACLCQCACIQIYVHLLRILLVWVMAHHISCVAECCSASQCNAMCCSVLRRVLQCVVRIAPQRMSRVCV